MRTLLFFFFAASAAFAQTKYDKFVPNAPKLHQSISMDERYRVIGNVPLNMVMSAPGHDQLRDPAKMLKGAGEIQKWLGTHDSDKSHTPALGHNEPITLNVFTDVVNGQAKVRSVEEHAGNQRLATALKGGLKTLGDIPANRLNILVNGYDTNGGQHSRWIPLDVAESSTIPKAAWHRVPDAEKPKGPSAEIPGNISGSDAVIADKYKSVPLDKVIDTSLKRLGQQPASP
jgi:hypothetical protein